MARRPDASMSLLTDLQEDALEPEYRTTTHRRRNGPAGLVALLLVGVLVTVAFLQTTRGSGDEAAQRSELLERIETARSRQAELTGSVAALDDEVRTLGQAALGDPAQVAELERLELVSGALAVTGPGIVVVVGDAPTTEATLGIILDADITRLVNGLWLAGAEAISINGIRLTTMTPIRSAGAAITVDYVSLSPPYRLEVIGDPSTLQARFNETPGAVWWHFLTDNYGVSMTITQADGDLTLAADTGMALRHAVPG